MCVPCEGTLKKSCHHVLTAIARGSEERCRELGDLELGRSWWKAGGFLDTNTAWEKTSKLILDE